MVGLATTVHVKATLFVAPLVVSVTVRVTADEPITVGVPVMRPLALIAMPAGNVRGDASLQR